MGVQYTTAVGDEERRAFLKALGVSGAVAAGSATLDDVREATSPPATDEVQPVGDAIADDLTGELDAELIARHQSELAERTGALTAVLDRGVPADGPREEFGRVAAAARPIYDHLLGAGFFESATEHLPAFDAEYVEASVRRAVATDALPDALAESGFAEREQVDLLATVVNHRRRLGERHWVQTDRLPRERMTIGEHVPTMTGAAAGGALLWLDDLDEHLWSQQVLLTDDALADAVWEARAMAAGLQLMAEGARAVGSEDSALSGAERPALSGADRTAVLVGGFALQAIAQNLLPEDVYWLSEERRAPARTDLEPADVDYWSEEP
jgi:hypothetical protein